MNEAVHSFNSVLIKEAAILDGKLEVVELPPTLQPEVLTSNVSDDVAGREPRNSDFQG